jgi:CDP-diacylglycerol--glycerol-3-phosphate 3-phosphatidyltransferase
MTTANKITVLRILLVPFFVTETIYYVQSGNEVHRLLAILSFAVAAICDGVDGYVARHYHQTSELGTILDPLADKLLLVSAIVVLSWNHDHRLGQIPLWLTGIIIGRDVLLLIGALLIRTMVGKITVKPRLTGKIATVFQMVLVVWLLLKWDFDHNPEWIKTFDAATAVFTVVSGWFYIWDGMKQLGDHPASSPTNQNK